MLRTVQQCLQVEAWVGLWATPHCRLQLMQPLPRQLTAAARHRRSRSVGWHLLAIGAGLPCQRLRACFPAGSRLGKWQAAL